MKTIKDLETRQRDHYARVSATYSRRRASISGVRINDYIDSKIEKMAQWSADKPVLLLGCGSHKPGFISRKNLKFIGLDLSIDMLRIFSEKYTNSVLIQASAFSLPFKDESISFVVARGSLHHLPILNKAFGQLKKIMEPKGLILFLEPFDDWIVWRTIRKVVYLLSNSLDYQSERTLRMEELKNIVNNNDCEIEFVESSGLFTFLFLRNDDISYVSRIFTTSLLFPIVFSFAKMIDAILDMYFIKTTWVFPELLGRIKKN